MPPAWGAECELPPIGADGAGDVPDRPRAHDSQSLGIELPGPIVLGGS